MRQYIRAFFRKYPPIFDKLRLLWWKLSSQQSTVWKFLDEFSSSRDQVNFIQLGANDGLNNDPIRGFIFRDKWSGIFVEPLPEAFEMLKNNNRHFKQPNLIYVNAAISSSEEDLSFWTYSDDFLSQLSVEDKLSFQRKSSLKKNHLVKMLKILKKLSNEEEENLDEYLKEIKIPCLSLEELMQKYWKSNKIDILVIDVEGYEASIIKGIDFSKIEIDTIYFESGHLGKQKQEVYEMLRQNDFQVTELGIDSIAQKVSLKNEQ